MQIKFSRQVIVCIRNHNRVINFCVNNFKILLFTIFQMDFYFFSHNIK